MKKLFTLLLAVVMLLSACGAPAGEFESVTDTETESESIETKAPKEDFKINVLEDTYVMNANNDGDLSDKNFSAEPEICAKIATGKILHRIGFVKFDISALVGDEDFTCIDLELTLTNRENDAGDPEKGVIEIYACDPSLDLTTVTYNTRPEHEGFITKNTEITTQKVTRLFSITDYVRQALAKGQTEIVLMINEATPVSPLYIRFASKESGTNMPKLSVHYGTKVDNSIYVSGGGAVGEPVLSQNGLDSLLGFTQTSSISVLEDTYTEAGGSQNNNYGNKTELSFKGSYEKVTQYYRVVLLKFDISEMDIESSANAKLLLYCNYMETSSVPTTLHVYGCDPYSWSEESVTYSTIPEKEELINTIVVSSKGWVTIDISNYVKMWLERGEKQIALFLEGDQDSNKALRFNSRESGSSAPYIEYSEGSANFTTYLKYKGENPWELAMTNVKEWLARWDVIKNTEHEQMEKVTKIASEYSLSVDVSTASKTDGYNTQYTAYPTRVISTLEGYVASTAETAQYDIYGGLMDESLRQEATGYFYVKKIGDRWWNIDPLGYPLYRVSMVSVSMGSALQKERFLAKYGSQNAWAQATSDRLHELGFNSFGSWCSIPTFIDSQNPLNQTTNLGVAAGYASSIGTNISNSGSTKIMGDVIPAFDPDFAIYAESKIASGVKDYKNSSFVYGWMSDNELPHSLSCLDNALHMDTTDVRFVYTYATAWTFMYLKTGKLDVSAADVTDELRLEFRAMVFDKYFSIVTSLLDKYAPNHMYMGSRFHGSAFKDESIMRVAGYWCDVITFNYYSAWDADFELASNIVTWAGKPFIVTEWYAKGMDVWEQDNRMVNKSGAGWTVRTQADRGKFYQNFALSLMECKGCVGFDWFKYIDNDPDAKADASNENANKGIVDNYGNEYTALTTYMEELNKQKYNLIRFFDGR